MTFDDIAALRRCIETFHDAMKNARLAEEEQIYFTDLIIKNASAGLRDWPAHAF